METEMKTNAPTFGEGFFFDHVQNPLFGDYERIEDDDFLDANNGYADAFAFSASMEVPGIAFSTNVSLAVAVPVRDETSGAYSGHWKVGFTSVELDKAPIGDIARYVEQMGCTSLSDFADLCGGAWQGFEQDFPTWEQTLGEFLCRGNLVSAGFEWMGCPSEKSAVALMNMLMKANIPVGFFEENLVLEETYDLDSERDETFAARDASLPERGNEENPVAGEH